VEKVEFAREKNGSFDECFQLSLASREILIIERPSLVA